jgi:molecular chaperone GrpE
MPRTKKGDRDEELHEELEESAPAHEVEDDAEVTELEGEPATIEALLGQLEEAKQHWSRARADYQNLKRRAQADLDNGVMRAMLPLYEGLLLVLDNLEMALKTPCETEEAKNLATGVQMTRDQLLRSLEAADVKPVAESGPFDPEVHQAMTTVPTDEVPAGEIASVVRRGYTWKYGVLRPAQVLVAADPAENSEQGGESKGSKADE